MDTALKKRNGVHYTPPRLAQFLAEQTVRFLELTGREIIVLDPACGDGELLESLLRAWPSATGRVRVMGFDSDAGAIDETYQRLKSYDIEIEQADFLRCALNRQYDVVIANPPYVRTQVLGGNRAQQLAAEFGLSGRVDLYQAFTARICQVLKPGGVMGLLTSNRFLTTKTGAAMRRLLREHFSLKAIFDLGDTKLFEAAVLPAVLIAVKNPCQKKGGCEFTRVYVESASASAAFPGDAAAAILEAVSDGKSELVETCRGRFKIERGRLPTSNDKNIWSLVNEDSLSWLAKIRSKRSHSFGELAEIKVGIKTTADGVFIRDNWNAISSEQRPETQLIRPLITHHAAARWSIERTTKSVLYPYDLTKAKRTVVNADEYPKSFRYLESYRERLESRKYVTDSGRSWYEIWVPHQPVDWARPKIVWPDISEEPRFFLDNSGAIVNGDCYWIKLRSGVDPEWLYLILAVANSSVATNFYDTVFHNKLYAGRRRFMTQYVKEFPLPEIDSQIGKRIVALVRQQVERPTAPREQTIETLVLEAFGLQ